MWDGNLFSDMVIRKSGRMDGFGGGLLPDFWVNVFWWKVRLVECVCASFLLGF
jgi:hypothetical protein